MQNAFLRMGRIQFAKRYQNGQISNFSVTCSLVAVAPKKDQPDEILAVEFSGSDSAMAGISAALQENEEVSIVCPDQSRMRGLKFGNTEAICGMNDRLELNEKKAKTTAGPGSGLRGAARGHRGLQLRRRSRTGFRRHVVAVGALLWGDSAHGRRTRPGHRGT